MKKMIEVDEDFLFEEARERELERQLEDQELDEAMFGEIRRHEDCTDLDLEDGEDF